MVEQTLKEKTAKGLFWGGISNGIQQLLGVIIGIVLLKNLTPDDYGMVGKLAIFTAIANTIQETGFTAALVNQPKFKREDYNAVFWFNIIVGALIYFILFFCASFIADFYNQPELLLLSRVLFLSIIISCLGIAHNAVLFKKMMVKEKAIIDITSTCIGGIAGIYLVTNGFGYWTLVIQSLVYSFFGVILRWFYSPWRPDFCISFKPIIKMFGFSYKLLLSSIVAQIQVNIFSVLLGKFYTNADVGYYSQGTKWANMGSQVINGMVMGVAQPVFSQVLKENERQVYIFRKMIRFVAFISFPCMLGLAFISNDFICIVNKDFMPCAPILQLYCLMGAIVPIQVLYGQMVISYGRSNFYFWCSLISAITQIITAFAVMKLGIYWMAFAVTIMYYFYLLIWHYFVKSFLQIRFIDIVKDILPYCLISLFTLFIVYWLTIYVSNLYLLIFFKILLSFVIYLLILKIFNSVALSEAISFFKTKINDVFKINV